MCENVCACAHACVGGVDVKCLQRKGLKHHRETFVLICVMTHYCTGYQRDICPVHEACNKQWMISLSYIRVV